MQENAHLSFSAPLLFPYIPPHISSGVLPSNSTPAKKIHTHAEPPPTQTEGQKGPRCEEKKKGKQRGEGRKEIRLIQTAPSGNPRWLSPPLFPPYNPPWYSSRSETQTKPLSFFFLPLLSLSLGGRMDHSARGRGRGAKRRDG